MRPYIKPLRPRPTEKANPDNQVSNWTLSYRLKGMTMALALAGFYNYFYLPAWDFKLLIASLILGYFLGWLVGRFYYSPSPNNPQFTGVVKAKGKPPKLPRSEGG